MYDVLQFRSNETQVFLGKPNVRRKNTYSYHTHSNGHAGAHVQIDKHFLVQTGGTTTQALIRNGIKGSELIYKFQAGFQELAGHSDHAFSIVYNINHNISIDQCRNTPRFEGFSPAQRLFRRRQRTKVHTLPTADVSTVPIHEACAEEIMEKQKQLANKRFKFFETLGVG
ncbi:unnamed protein product [Lepeophtheirus salmonis]|uniref:(salmon louse) hypothetical protein n=1 Tax=Lepeophtheirus salmonis TaxID=72036 RepID=A0A7R8CMX4_LEPSM|nr:unnamed protein product [Lepeophtheirus salmonis]CAF2870137.1 unnamed protein product [Lepeophtheirus salmonis]